MLSIEGDLLFNETNFDAADMRMNLQSLRLKRVQRKKPKIITMKMFQMLLKSKKKKYMRR